MNAFRIHSEKGYSLVEILTVLVILGLVSTGLMVTFIIGQREYSVRDATIRMQQQVRLAMAQMERNIKMTGYGLIDLGNLKINIYQGGVISSWAIVEAGDGAGGGHDTITIHYQNPELPSDLEANIVTLTADYPSSKPNLLLLSSSADFQVGDFFLLYDPAAPNKPASMLQVSSIPGSADRLLHSSGATYPYNPPNATELFPAGGYGLGSRVINLRTNEMKKVTYSIVNDNLERAERSNLTGVTQSHIVATGIEDLQFRYQFADGTWLDTLDAGHDVVDLRGVRISVIARTAAPDSRYSATESFQLTGPLGNGGTHSGGGYRRMTMSTMISLRNMAMRANP